MTQNYGLAGGQLDATKHIELARDPARYMLRLAQRPWMVPLTRPDAQAARQYLADQSSN